MRFLSLFSGIEAASVAWAPLGWECVAVAEIDKFACDLLKKRFPKVPNLGDVTRITREQIVALGRIDVVIAGFPCQDVSVAGKRAGLKDAHGKRTRSGLFHVARRLIHWSRARWAVLENVPGLFTSRAGRDFATVVGKMVGRQFDPPPGGWRNAGVAAGRLGLVEWATLDSQYFHVAQRRERVFLVRDAGAWADRPPVLLVPQGSLGDPPTRGEAGARAAGALTSSTARRGPGADPHSRGATLIAEPGTEVVPPLSAGDNSAGGGRLPGMSSDDAQGLVACHPISMRNASRSDASIGIGTPGTGVGVDGAPANTLAANGVDAVAVYRKSRRAQTKDDDETWVEDGRANTLNAFDVGERDTHAVVAPVAIPDPAYALSAGAGGSKFGTGRERQDTFIVGPLCADGKAAGSATQQAAESGHLVAHTLTGEGHDASEDGTGRGTPIVPVVEPIPFDPKQISHPANHSSPKAGAPCHPLRAVANCEPAIAFHVTQDPIHGAQSPCLSQGNQQGCGTVGVLTQARVRRLTPVECERLQGFPDGWTAIKRRPTRKSKNPSPDGPRYRALGNSMTTTVIRWIGERIELAAKGAP